MSAAATGARTAAAERVAALSVSPDAATAAAMLVQQVRMHRQNVPWAAFGALVLAALFVGVQWRAIPLPALLGWAASLVVVMVWRGALWARHGDAEHGGDLARAWQRRYRVNFLAHGLVWAAASWLPMPAGEPLQVALLMMMLAGICASNFILNAFDLTAALLFGVPTMVALSLRLMLAPGSGGPLPLMGLAVLLALGFFAMTGRRAHRMVRENTALRLAEARQNHLLRVLITTTHEGFWFIDNAARTVDANPAMCRMLGVPLDALVGRSIYDFVDEANRAVFAREVARRAQGEGGGYEITLRRPDGSTVDCYNQATPIVDAQGQRIGSVGLWTDITERKRAERALRETGEALRRKSQQLQDTLASLGQGVLHWGADGEVLAWNQRMLELLEMPPDLIRPGTRQVDLSQFLIARGDLHPAQELFDDSGRPLPMPGTPGQLPDLYVRRTPSGLLLEVRTRRLPDGGAVRTFADVTAYIEALQRLAERERVQRELLEAFPGVMLVTDDQHRYTHVNQRFAEMAGQPAERLIGQHVADVVGEPVFRQLCAELEEVRRSGPVHAERDYPATAWRPRTQLQVTHAIGRDTVTGRERIYAFGIDISARKAAEAALVAARDEAERANRAKSQFLSSMSHELRTPLNAILGFGHLLANDRRQPLPPNQRRQLDEMLRGARHLLHLINEILDLAVVESGSLSVQRQTVPLAPAVAEALALLQPLAAERGVVLPPDPPALSPGAAVQADPVRLKQVLLNLLGNAIKYNRPLGRVGLAVDPVPPGQPAQAWRIAVQDDGPGLDSSQQARLFSAFDRLGAEGGPVEGSGLGLALSRGLARAMGGEIGVDSAPGAGSLFWLQLPAATVAAPGLDAPTGAPTEAANGATAGTTNPANATHTATHTTSAGHLDAATRAPQPDGAAAAEPRLPVLYVEDNPVNRMLMEAVFEDLPQLDLVLADSAAAGLALAEARRPQLLLLDIQLPDLDGHALLQRLRALPHLRDVPAIAVSADATPEAVRRGQAAGFGTYLTKPLDMDRLVAVVQASLLR